MLQSLRLNQEETPRVPLGGTDYRVWSRNARLSSGNPVQNVYQKPRDLHTGLRRNAERLSSALATFREADGG